MAGNCSDNDLFVIGFSFINFSIGLLNISKPRFAHRELELKIHHIEFLS